MNTKQVVRKILKRRENEFALSDIGLTRADIAPLLEQGVVGETDYCCCTDGEVIYKLDLSKVQELT